jgi:hypothetical protein
VLEDVYIFFTYEVAADKLPWVFVKTFSHCHSSKRLSTIHATFYGWDKMCLILELNNSVKEAPVSYAVTQHTLY